MLYVVLIIITILVIFAVSSLKDEGRKSSPTILNEKDKAKRSILKWRNHKDFEQLQYSLIQIPKLLNPLKDIKDKTRLSNHRKSIALYDELKKVGFLDDLILYRENLIKGFATKRFPVEGMGNITFSDLVLGTTMSYLIISNLKVICPYLEHEDDANIERLALKLIGELKGSGLPLNEKENEVFKNNEPSEIAKKLTY